MKDTRSLLSPTPYIKGLYSSTMTWRVHLLRCKDDAKSNCEASDAIRCHKMGLGEGAGVCAVRLKDESSTAMVPVTALAAGIAVSVSE